MKFCKDCKHCEIEVRHEHIPGLKVVIENDVFVCNKTQAFDLVTGKPKNKISCALYRSNQTGCTKEALYWEAK